MNSTTPKARIGDMLIAAGLISQEQLVEALRLQKEEGGKTVENLIALEYLDPHDFVNFLSRQPGVASINLLNYTIPKDVIELVPAAFALKHEILPIDKLGKDLTVGMACPLDSKSISDLEEHTGLRVRPLLVSMSDIRVALNRYYAPKEEKSNTFSLSEDHSRGSASAQSRKAALPTPELERAESTLTFEGIVHLVRQIHSLPALPETVAHVKEVIENPESSANDLAAIVERDPNITVKVVSMANSAAYGLAHRVDTIEMATRMLGLNEVYTIVLSSAVIDYFSKDAVFNYKIFWKRSMRCAITSRIIALKCGMKSCGGVFTAGLLHDIGKVVCAEIAPERYLEVNQDRQDNEIIEQENEIFGMAHPEVGFMLVDNWGLPNEIIQPVRFHHAFGDAQECTDLVAIVALGSLMASTYGKINKDNVQDFANACQELLKTLNLSEKEFVAILGESSKAIKEDAEVQ